MQNINQLTKNRMVSGLLLMVASLLIFTIAQTIETLLIEYELSSMYISFCAGFILFIPLVSLVLHPLLFNDVEDKFTFEKLNPSSSTSFIVKCVPDLGREFINSFIVLPVHYKIDLFYLK